MLNFNQLPVLDLGPELVLNNQLYIENVVVTTWQGEEPFVLLISRLSRTLTRFGSDELSRMIPFILTETPCNDVCVFKGRPYVVDRTGQTIVVGSDLRVHLVVKWVSGGCKKFLVESEGELLLLDKYLFSKSFCFHNEVGCE